MDRESQKRIRARHRRLLHCSFTHLLHHLSQSYTSTEFDLYSNFLFYLFFFKKKKKRKEYMGMQLIILSIVYEGENKGGGGTELGSEAEEKGE